MPKPTPKESPVPEPCEHDWAEAEVTRETVTFAQCGTTHFKLVLYGRRGCRLCGAEEEFALQSMPWPIAPA